MRSVVARLCSSVLLATGGSVLVGGCADGGGAGGDGDGNGSEGEGEGPGPGSCIVEGTVTIENTLDAAAMQTVCGVTGDLRVLSNGLTSLSLPNLKAVGGRLLVDGNSTLATLALPQLATVGEDLSFDNNAGIAALEMPALASVGGSLAIELNAALASLAFPVLADIGASLTVNGNPLLASAAFPVLAGLGGDLTVTDNPALAALAIPALTTVGGDAHITGNALPDDVVFDAIEVTPEHCVTTELRVRCGDGYVVELDPGDPGEGEGEGEGEGPLPDCALEKNVVIVDEARDDGDACSVFPCETIVLNPENALDLKDICRVLSLTIKSNDVVELSFDSLTTIDGNLLVSQSGSLARLSFPRLATIGGDLIVQFNPTLDTLSMPQLTSARGIGIFDSIATCEGSVLSMFCPQPPQCGDGSVNGDEECEGSVDDGFTSTCEDFSLAGAGAVTCNPVTCTYDTSACAEPLCGDGFVNGSEACDGSVNFSSCEDFGFFGGGLLDCVDCNVSTDDCVD